MIEDEQARRRPDAGARLERHAPRVDPALLTPRQREIAQLIAVGYTNAEIGAELSVDRTLVAEEVERLLNELRLDGRLEIAAWALAHAPDRGARHGGP